MKKKALLRGLLGFPLGIAIGYVITIVLSLIIGDGSYSPSVPSLVVEVGSEIGAVVLQTVLCGLLGASFSAASAIWEAERWSIARQTGIYFLVISITMLPIAYFAHWMERTVAGFLFYFGIFTAVFAVVWVVQYFIWKVKLNRINQKIGERK